MQKNTNDLKKEEPINKKNTTKAVTKSTASKTNKSSSSKSGTSTSKKISTKATNSKSTKTKTTVAKNSTKSSVKSTTTSKKASVPKKSSTSKVNKTVKKVVDKSSSNKNSSKSTKNSKFTQKKATTKKSSKAKTTKNVHKVDIIEYYDLPYRYNQTVVKILAQTPTTLFVYWDISDDDRKTYIDKFGEHFFENTYPILIVHNKTMNYSFEIEINDFANSWYFNVRDAKCEYEIELGRRAKPYEFELPNNYMYIASSNVIEAPNDHILFEKNQRTVFFRNIKNNTTSEKDISKFEFMNYIGQIYNIYDVYMKIYKNEELDNLRNNPSSDFKL